MGLSDNIVDWIKLSPKYLLPLFMACSVLLFSSTEITDTLGVTGLVTSYRGWIGVIFIVTGSLLLSHVFFWVKDIVKRRLRSRRMVVEGRKYLRQLTPEEREVLAKFVAEDTRTQNLDFSSGVTNGLVANKVIYRASTVGSMLGGFSYNIQPWAWKELKDNPDLLEPELSQGRREGSRSRTRLY